nr:hypothetical protein [Bradyrhizobium nitroreducens]
MLGCARMAEFTARHGLPVVDGVAAAVTARRITGAA